MNVATHYSLMYLPDMNIIWSIIVRGVCWLCRFDSDERRCRVNPVTQKWANSVLMTASKLDGRLGEGMPREGSLASDTSK